MKRWLVRLWLPAVGVAFWQIAASQQWLDPLFFPSPTRLLDTFWKLTAAGDLATHLSATLARLMVAYTAGSVAGVAIGLSLGRLPFWRRSTQSIMSGLYSSPKLALLPAFLVLFGVNDFSRTLPAGLSCFVLMAVYSMDAVRAVKPTYVDLARIYGADRRARFFRVYVPACLPSLFTGLRIGLGTGLVMVVATEMLGAPSGLGAFIWITATTLAVDRMYVGIALCGLVGAVTNYLFERLERRMAPWIP